MAGGGSAFVKGGLGCLAGSIVLGLSCVLIGGSFHINAGGAVLVFLIGGVIGLIVFWIYSRGRRDATQGGQRGFPVEPYKPDHDPYTDRTTHQDDDRPGPPPIPPRSRDY